MQLPVCLQVLRLSCTLQRPDPAATAAAAAEPSALNRSRTNKAASVEVTVPLGKEKKHKNKFKCHFPSEPVQSIPFPT